MLTFLDGPAAGVKLACSRAPIFLRVVCGAGMDGQWDALDQLMDVPEADEVVHVYRLHQNSGTIHLDGVDKRGKRFGRWEQIASYKLHETQPDAAVLRSNIEWRKWATAEALAIKATEETP